jgi:hypothetical protein
MASHALKLTCGLLLLAVTGCETAKSSNPTAPTVAGPIPGVEISAPGLLEPAQGFKFKEAEQPIRLVIQNASTNGVRPLTYTFEVASDAEFTSKVFSRSKVAPGDGKTSVQLDRLEIGRNYYWRAHAEDGANTGLYATAGFEIYPKPAVNAPAPVAPVNNDMVGSATPSITVSNASWIGPIGNLVYEFQIASDQAFSRLVSAGVIVEGAGQTTFNSASLTGSATMFWRARATDGETTSAWTVTQVFRTPAPPAPPPPAPGPSPAPGAACVSSDPLTIVTCERNKYGHMSDSQMTSFLSATARSLNVNGIGGGPFGLLVKTGGHQCNGYSCDIICAGQGASQRQWDVLGDSDGAQTPGWNGPATVPDIRIDVCEIK